MPKARRESCFFPLFWCRIKLFGVDFAPINLLDIQAKLCVSGFVDRNQEKVYLSCKHQVKSK